jgi:mono/diheme cytochrome c family protein
MSDPVGRENKEPFEGTSVERFGLPLLLLGFIAGFGTCYLLLMTPNFSARYGDSRTVNLHQRAESSPTNSGNTEATSTNQASANSLGAKTYSQVCQACHQANGKGIPGAFPPLDGSEWVSNKNQVAAIVLKGLQGDIEVKGQKFAGVMPPHDQQLANEQIQAVVNYVRSSWGNSFEDQITVEEVEELRNMYGDQELWTSEKLSAEFDR